ncbi:hypothetical protein [Domibacillus indicus]|uniref:hypothetical protein n=1 Tax=Domibacillus indicus TaxID=1437523 RepID=UPI000618366E|nr:hypothetical protein [Domibacillus indicus]
MEKKSEAPDIYETIRNAGFLLETQLNEWIQNQLNKEQLVLPAALLSNVHGKLIEFISEFQEIISLHLNTPTKDDVANVARLVIQTEEKVDDLNDRMEELAAVIEELSTGTTHKKPVSSHPLSARHASRLPDRIEEKADDLVRRMDELEAIVKKLGTKTGKRPASSCLLSARHAKENRKSEARDTKKKAILEELLSPRSFVLLNSDSIFGDEAFSKLLQDVKQKRRKKI